MEKYIIVFLVSMFSTMVMSMESLEEAVRELHKKRTKNMLQRNEFEMKSLSTSQTNAAMMMGMESGSKEKILRPREKVTRIMALSRAHSTATVSSSGDFLMKYENIRDGEDSEDSKDHDLYLNPKDSSFHRTESFSSRDQACSPAERSFSFTEGS